MLGRVVRGDDLPNPSRSYAMTDLVVVFASAAGKSCHISTEPNESCKRMIGSRSVLPEIQRRTKMLPPGTATNESSVSALIDNDLGT